MTHPRLIIAVVAGLVLAPGVVRAQGVAQQGTAVSAVKSALDARWSRVAELAKAADAGGLARLYTADAILIDPSAATMTGRASIEKFYRDFLSTTKFLGVTHRQASLDIVGDAAVETGTYTMRLHEKGKAPMQLEQRYVNVWRKGDGGWLLQRDVTIPMPPAPKH